MSNYKKQTNNRNNRNQTKFIKFGGIFVLSFMIVLLNTNQTSALIGQINDVINDMNSGQTNTTNSGCASCTTTNNSSSLINQINNSINDQLSQTNQNTNYSNNSTSIYTFNTPTSQAYPPSCPFSNTQSRRVVYFNQSIRADLSESRSRFSVNTYLPEGVYDIRVFTWDDHSYNGGQDQNNEEATLRLLNSSGQTVYTTNRTQDIPNSINSIISTVATDAALYDSIHEVLVFHPEYHSSNPESLTPICAEFRMTDYISDDPDDPDPDEDLDVECRVSDTNIEEGDEVEFEAIVTGGNSPFDYDWDGDINSTYREFEVEFDDEGNYYIDVTVTDNDGNTAYDSCPVIRVEEEDDDDDWDNDDLEVQCILSDSTIEEGDYVTIEVDIDGGDYPFDIEWEGDADEIDDFDLNDRYQRIRVEDEGTYRLRVEVEDDDGNRDSDTCTLRVRNEDDNDRDINVYSDNLNNPNGDLAGLSSVYLNQVPYTGPEDTIKIFGFIALILIWSATISCYVLKARKKKQTSNRIEAFKQTNRNQLIG
jgi:hypothetical protein